VILVCVATSLTVSALVIASIMLSGRRNCQIDAICTNGQFMKCSNVKVGGQWRRVELADNPRGARRERCLECGGK
jgi:hypothetical protein